MAEIETYVTKKNPSVEDWMEYNHGLFARLKGTSIDENPRYAPFVDVDQHAAKVGTSTEEYFDQVKDRVGSLGRAGLKLVHSEMDNAWHIVVALKEDEVQDL